MRILTVVSWIAVLTMFAYIGWRLADQFAPEYPAQTGRYTDAAFKSLQYENAQNKYDKTKAMEFIRSIADGNIGK